MFTKIKQIFSPQHKDLQRKIKFTIFALFIFKLGTAVIVPGINKESLQTSTLGFLELINIMGGGAMEQFSIFALGVMPYITASIIMQLAQMDVVPYFSELAKEGHTGKQKINKITRVLGIAIAFIQGYLMSFAFVQNGTVLEYMQFSLVLTAGTAFLLWMGDRITVRGIGNGISLIIMAGIIASMPSMFMNAWGILDDSQLGILLFSAFVFLYLAIIVGVIFVETATRRIPIQYANKSTSFAGNTYIPFKLNSAGVIPVIFASTLLSIPAFVSQFAKNEAIVNFVEKYMMMNSGPGFILYIALIMAFAYFYTHLQMKPKEMAENLQKNGGYIPGIRPGKDTIEYFKYVLNHLTFVGAMFLAFIAGLPIIFANVTGLPASVSIGGTGLLIVVGVALETYKKIDSELTSRTFEGRRGRRKWKKSL